MGLKKAITNLAKEKILSLTEEQQEKFIKEMLKRLKEEFDLKDDIGD